MKKSLALLLSLAMLLSASASAETLFLTDYGFYFTLPDGWTYTESALTEEYVQAGVVHGIDAHAADGALTMWLEIYATSGGVAADKMGVMEFEGRIADLKEYYPDMAYFIVGNTPFIYYTATDDDGAYLTAYTWTESYQFSFIFFAKELTDDVRKVIAEIMETYKPL